MLIHVTSFGHGYTFDAVRSVFQPGTQKSISYDTLWSPGKKPKGCYLLTDYDRLTASQRETATEIAKRLKEGGSTVLNKPNRFRDRFQTLKYLRLKAMIDYEVWDVATGEWPNRFPVFLRTKAGHRGNLTNLLHTHAEAEEALQHALSKDFGLSDLMFVEFCNDAVDDGIYQRRSVFRMGENYVMDLIANNDVAFVKRGRHGAASAESYAKEHQDYFEDKFSDWARTIFETLEIEYGRLDFGLSGGKPQAYEINTNPSFALNSYDHPSSHRNEVSRAFEEKRAKALLALNVDLSGHSKVPVNLNFGPFKSVPPIKRLADALDPTQRIIRYHV